MTLVVSLVLIGLGLVLAFAGRRFVWLLVGAAGFLIGYWLMRLILPGNGLLVLLLSLAAGLVAAFFIRGITQLILAVVGFILVGSAAVGFAGLVGIAPFSLSGIVVFLAGGILGLILAGFVGSVGLMIVTALAGASLVRTGLPDLGIVAGSLADAIAAVVAVAGFLVQYTGRNR